MSLSSHVALVPQATSDSLNLHFSNRYRINLADLGTVKPVRTEGVFGILPKIKGGSVGLLNIQ